MKTRVFAALLAVTLVGCREHADGHGQAATDTTAPVTATTTATVAAPFDLQFLDTMTRHHQGAVDMAKAAEGKVTLPELKALVVKIPADQQKEISQMTSIAMLSR